LSLMMPHWKTARLIQRRRGITETNHGRKDQKPNDISNVILIEENMVSWSQIHFTILKLNARTILLLYFRNTFIRKWNGTSLSPIANLKQKRRRTRRLRARNSHHSKWVWDCTYANVSSTAQCEPD
jgi:hypothetical protein